MLDIWKTSGTNVGQSQIFMLSTASCSTPVQILCLYLKMYFIIAVQIFLDLKYILEQVLQVFNLNKKVVLPLVAEYFFGGVVALLVED